MNFSHLWLAIITLVLILLVYDRLSPKEIESFTADTLTANELAIVDENGKERICMTTTCWGEEIGNPRLLMRGNDGASIELQISYDKPELVFETDRENKEDENRRMEIDMDQFRLARFNPDTSSFENVWVSPSE